MLALNTPITWQFFVTEVAKALIKGIVTELIKGIFSNRIDLQALLEVLLREIDNIITQRIQEEFIQQHKIKMFGLQNMLEQYSNSPTKERLDYIYSESTMLAVAFADDRYEYKTYREYIISVSLQLIALEEYYKTIPNEKKNIIQTIEKAKSHILELNKGLKNMSDERFTIIPYVDRDRVELKFDDGDSVLEVEEGTVYCVVERKSRNILFCGTQREAREQLEKIKADKYNSEVYEVYIRPSLDVMNLWDERVRQLNNS